jgi:hypothetical protein
MTPEELGQELDNRLQKADRWPNAFNLSQLGVFVLQHPEVIGRTDAHTPHQAELRRYEQEREAGRRA